MIRQIIKEYLEENGFKGLVNPNIPCGCGADDICPCNGDDFCMDLDNCKPARFLCHDPKCGDGEDGDIFYCNRNPETCEYKVGGAV